MHKRQSITLAIILLLALLITTPAFAQEKSLYAKRYDVDITVLANGDMRIIERLEIVFTQGSFREGFAIIPTGRTEGLANIQVMADGVAYQRATSGEQPGTFTVEDEGNQVAITWYFPYTSKSTHVYELHYTVKGGLRYYPEYGEVWWKAIPPEHAYSIRNATIRVRLPPGATILKNEQTGADYAGLTPAIAQSVITSDRLEAIFTTNRTIYENEEVEVRVRFTPGVVAGQAPAWQQAFDRQQEWETTYKPTLNLLLGLAGAVVALGGPLLVLGLWYVFGRDPSVGLMADEVSDLPANTPPGLAGALVDEKADLQDILATLVDLARRGYLTITEEKGSSLFAARDFSYRRTNKPADDLRPYEQLLLKELFGNQTERRLSSLKDNFYVTLPRLQNALYKELVREGFFSTSPESIRTRYGCMGGAVLVLAIAGGIALTALLASYVDTMLCPFIGLGLTGIVLIIAGQYMPHKTRRGAEAAALWRAFKKYLTRIEKYNLPEARERFDEFLPYAVAFGLERSLIKKFASVQAPMPTWYRPYPYYGSRPPGMAQPMPASGPGKEGLPSVQQMSDSMAGSLQSMSDGLISMFNATSRTFTSQPSSSSSSSGGWSGGGGFHGGGGGGGGDRGFR